MRNMSMIGALILTIAGAASAQERSKSLTVTMSNNPTQNMILVYDTSSHALLQSVPSQGKGGVAGNARGVMQLADKLFVAVNYGRSTVAVFNRKGDSLEFAKLLSTSSAPVSVDFANGHLYVAGTKTLESFPVLKGAIGARDGAVALELAGGGAPPAGSTAQVGALKNEALVTFKMDPLPGTVDVVKLDERGAVTGKAGVVPAPERSLTPFGFSTFGDGTALITLAHSEQLGLFKSGAFTSVIESGGQAGPCWTTRIGKYVFIVNAGSMTVSRVVTTGSNIFIDSAVATPIRTGGAPTDADSTSNRLVVLDHTATTSHLSFFDANEYGELTADQSPIDLGVPAANGVAIMGR